MAEKVYYWEDENGSRPIEDLSKDELLDCVRYAFGEIDRLRERNMSNIRMFGLFNEYEKRLTGETMNNGKPKYNTPNSTQNQTTQPKYTPEQAVVGTGVFKKGAEAIKGRQGRMRDRLKKIGY